MLALCVGNPPVTGGFPSQRATNVKSMPMTWLPHDSKSYCRPLVQLWSVTGKLCPVYKVVIPTMVQLWSINIDLKGVLSSNCHQLTPLKWFPWQHSPSLSPRLLPPSSPGCDQQGPLLLTWFNPAWISNHIHHQVGGKLLIHSQT